MWSVTNSTDGPQGSISKSVNQNSYGAKSALSEPQGLPQVSTTHHSVSDHSPHSDMQANVHNVESTQRYDVASSHGTSGSFLSTNGNGACRNVGGSNGAHSNNSDPLQVGAAVESSGSRNPSNMYGAQYNSVNRAKSHINGCENNSCGNTNSPYSGWQSLSSASGSSGSSGWNIPDSNGVGRNCRLSQNQSSSDSLGNDSEETMAVDSDMTYNGLIGATGGSEFADEKPSGNNSYKEGSPWGTPMPRMGLLGGGESSLNTSSTNWVGSNSSTTATTSGWGGGSRQSSGSSSEISRDNTGNSVENDMSYSGLVGAIGGSDFSDGKQNGSNNFRQESNRSVPPGRMGLLGGGESSMSSGPTGWGTPGTSGTTGTGWGNGSRQNNGATTEMTSNNGSGGMSPPKSHNSWAQAAGKGLNTTTTQNPTVNSSQTAVCSDSGSVSSVAGPVSSATKPRTDEPVTDLKMKAAFSDGWGKSTINQDSPWELPPSPPPSPPQPHSNSSKDNQAPAVWRAPVNNGTEIWENNLKLNKGVVTPVTSTTTPPWGHTPSTNIGGHWGDDDSSSNLWTGAPSSNAANSSNWAPEPNPCAGNNSSSSSSNSNNNNNNNTMWGNPPAPEKHWGGQGNSWNENASDNGTSMWNPSMNKPRNVGNWSPVNSTPKNDIQPSGWEQPSPPTGRRPAQNYDDGTALWGNPQRQGKVSHWKDMPSAKPIINSGNAIGPAVGIPPASMGGGMQPAGPGMIRLPTGATVNNKGDMQASVWNKPSIGRGNNWGEMPPHRDSSNIGNWGDDSHMHNQMKNLSASNAPGGPFASSWGEPTSPMAAYWGAKPKGATSWADGQVDTSTWLGPSKQGGKPLTRDLIYASKQFRMLIDSGYRKDDVENALRNNNMNHDDALAELQASGAPRDSGLMDVDNFTGRKIRPGTLNDDVSIPDHVLDSAFNSSGFHAPGSFQAPGNFHGITASQPFKQNKCPGPNNNATANLLNAALSGQQSSLGPISSVFTHKLLQMQQQQQVQSYGGPNNVPQNALGNQGGRMGQNSFPTAAQLRHLVQQIQMAVQAGHLNPQILNQPLAPQTLQLLYQLLQQIKVLTQLQQHQMFQNQQHISKPVGPGGPGSNSGLQLNVQITQTKQRITNLQNQIHAQQAVFLKNQQMQQSSQHQSLHAPQAPADIFKPNIEPMPALQSDFRELNIKDVPLQTHHTQSQSRLNQWKLPPSFEKEDSSLCGSNQNSSMNANNTFGNDFSRAPGPLPSKTSSASSAMPNSGSNLHPLLSQGDSAWSSLSRSQGDSGWPDAATLSSGVGDNQSGSSSSDNSVSTTVPSSGSNIQVSSDNKEQSSTPPTTGPSTSSASHTSYNLTDLVAEFEPGKPWKGTQIKNVEDDPHITPGSITRSPLSLNIKDSDLFNWNSKSSPATTTNDHSAGTLTSSTWVFTPATPAAPNSSSGSNKGPGWGSFMSEASPGSDVWGSSITKARGPPPGLSGHGWERNRHSTFLLLRNLTPQIDGSTLKTLCMQHGPLQLFHLSLNHGIALVQYSTREEASKAQVSLNNCVLGNTTILADIPNDVEVRHYLQILANQSTGGNMNWASQPQAGNAATSFRNNGTTYPFPSSATSTNNSAKLDSSGWNGNSLNMANSQQLWSFPNSTSSLWGGSQPISDHDQSTNTTLNSFLPGDLLGGEPM